MKPECNGNCNECCVGRNKAIYLAIAKLEKKLGLNVAGLNVIKNTINETCPNLSICPECKVDDFAHVEGCKLAKKVGA